MFFNHIFTASKPIRPAAETSTGAIAKKKDANRGFKTDITGKLIIDEPKRGAKKVDSDSDEDSDAEGGVQKQAKKPESDASDSDDEATENAKLKSRKRKASSALSQKSGKTGDTGKYVAGGKGIHRPMAGGAASVRSGYTNGTRKSTELGSEYRSKKSTGDMKKKGGLDPYAYIPLSRNTLNKRKRAKNSGQFKSIVQAARKGAAAGSK